jgi:hypothetical protein
MVVINIDFDEDANDSVIVHRIRNYGEDLFGYFRDKDIAPGLSIEEVGWAVNQLTVRVRDVRSIGQSLEIINERLRHHNLSAIAKIVDAT